MASQAPQQAGETPADQAQGTESRAISIRGLTKTFGKGEQALHEVDLDVAAGEFLVLLGPSGCGKTTLLRSIAGLERPDQGTIDIDGERVYDGKRVNVDAGQRPVTMIFQSYALWPHMTAAKNVAFPLKCAKVSREEIPGRVQDILERVGIGHLGERYPGEMSGGQQQRLALARALVVGQRIVLFDEPLSNVDAQVREKLRLELIRMQRTLGFTAIYVTHDQSEAMELADRIAVMAKGRIAQLDAPRRLYTAPADIDVARFLGQSNELPMTVEAFDAAASRVSGTAAVGPIAATWDPARDAIAPAAGEEVVAFGRPTDFLVVDAAARDEGWPGRIEAARFLGDHLEYVVQIGETRLRCWAPADGHEMAEGREVRVVIGADRLHAIRER